MDDTRAWVRGEIDGEWLEARVVSRDADGGATLETLSTKEQSTAKAEELLLANELPEQGVEDMTRLNYLHEPALLNNLRHRFALDHIYTYTGKICIAVNPFNWAVSKPLYAESLLVKYRAKEFGQLPPHVYAIAEEGYQRILAASALGKQDNQSILVSGESGAGKTESVKVMMQYLAFVSKSGDTNRVAEQVLASNPLLEAFGNARTLRNNNSSRFGKFIEIQFNNAYRMAGARIHVYLLEKSRVTQQSEGERSYHIFYQLLAGLSPEEKASLHLEEPASAYSLINGSSCMAIDGVDDAQELTRTRGAMEAVGMSEADKGDATRCLAAVLLLAQLVFEQGEDDQGASVAAASLPTLGHVAGLLSAEVADDLSGALCKRRLVTRDDTITVHLTLEQARDSRDALAKALYGRLFGWLVARCNDKLVDDRAASAFIGILDIFGFEAFKVNSFEQLCINYANERLQQQFNWNVFKAEQAEYEAEGIEWQYITFVDNQECLDLLDKKGLGGVLHLLDEECAMQQGTDAKFVQKIREKHKEHKYYSNCPRTCEALPPSLATTTSHRVCCPSATGTLRRRSASRRRSR